MDTEINWSEPPSGEDIPSVLAIYLSLLASAVAFGVILTMLFGSFVLFAILIDLRVVLTVALGALFGLFVERAVVYQFTAWRPPLPRLFVSGVVAAPLSVAVASALPWSPWIGIPSAVAAGLLVQAFALSFLSRSRQGEAIPAPSHGD